MIAKRPPDPESFTGYGIAGTVVRRCMRLLARGPEPQREDGTKISAEERKRIIDDLIRNAECRIVDVIDHKITPEDVDFGAKTFAGMKRALDEFNRVAAKKNLGDQGVLTVVFDDGSAFTFSDSGYDAYLPATLKVSPLPLALELYQKAPAPAPWLEVMPRRR